MAPEMMQAKEYGMSVDWFSFGMVLYEMLTGKNPFKSTTPIEFEQMPMRVNELLEMKDKILKNDGTFSDNTYDLLSRLLVYDVSKS